MYVQVFDEDSKREDLICEGEVDLSEVLREGEQDCKFIWFYVSMCICWLEEMIAWFPLKYRGKGSGKIYLELTFYSAVSNVIVDYVCNRFRLMYAM